MRGATGVDGALAGLRDAVADRARPAEDGDAVAGVVPRYVVRPGSTAETAEVMRVAAEHDLRVVARGAGTKQSWGLPPRQVDLVLDTTGLTGVVEHVAGDLVCVVRAGTPVESLQAVLAEAGQQLALDVPLPGATVGGTVAVSTSGPRRLLYGTLRDLLIGVTFVRADGVVASAGGKVVKNVAGYDFGKLLTGSYGTLGVVTEAVVRLHPLPPARRVVRRTVDDPAEAGRLAAEVLGSQLVPAAVEVEQRGGGPVTVTVLLEGIESGADLRAAVARELLGPGSSVDDRLPPGFTDLPFGPGETGLKATSTIAGVAPVLESLRRSVARHGVDVAVRGSAMGVLHAGLPAGTPPGAAVAVVEAVRAAARDHDGSVVVLTAPPDVREAVDVWGPVPGLDLMRRVKDELDPGHRLAPGRFVGGI